MENDLEIEIMKCADLVCRMVESVRIELERTVSRVPAVGAVAGAQINQSVTGKLFIPKGLRDMEWVIRASKRAMRLDVAEHPLGRHDGVASNSNKFCKGIRGFLSVDDE